MHSAKNFRFNFTVNVLDGAFFGAGLGFSSFVTMIPLFVATLTDSSVIIGFIASLHLVGWYLPQLLTANYVARLRRLKPFVTFMTTHERWPFFGLAVVALFVNQLGTTAALLLTLLFVVIHSLSAGLTAVAWQTMITKVITQERLGVFYGTQSAAANLFAAVAAPIAGLILLRVASPDDFAICFAITGFLMVISFFFLRATREPLGVDYAQAGTPQRSDFWRKIGQLLRRDVNFRWFLVARVIAQFAWMASNFYTIYAVRHFGIDEQTAGFMTSLLLISQTVSSPFFGWLGDHGGHRRVFSVGVMLMALGAVVAVIAPTMGWFYLVFGLTGFSNSVLWATSMSLTAEFGSESERPYYIGLTNTLIGPVALVAPLLGGVIVDNISFTAMFLVSGAAGLFSMLLMQTLVQDPRHLKTPKLIPQAAE